MFPTQCMSCQKPLETKEKKDGTVTRYVLYCPKCKYEVMDITEFKDMVKWAKDG